MLTKLGTYQRILLAIVIVGGVIWALLTQTNLFKQDEVPVVAATPISVEQTTETTEPAPVVEETVAVAEEAPAEETAVAAVEAPSASPEEAVVPETQETEIVFPLPAFDVVRVESDGSAIVAGSGPAGWTVSILLDGVEIATVVTDASGQFAAFVDFGLSEVARVVSLSATDGTQVLVSDAQVIIAPVLTMVAEAEEAVEAGENADAVTEVAEAVTEVTEAVTELTEGVTEAVEAVEEAVEAATAVVSTTSVDESAVTEASDSEATEAEETASTEQGADTTTEETAEAAPAEATTETEETTTADAGQADTAATEEAAAAASEAASEATDAAKAPAVLLVGKDGVEVLQPAKSGPEAMVELAIDAISYTENGDVQLSGRSAQGFLRVYLDNLVKVTLEVPEPGSWQTNLVDVAPGVYTLRIDRLDENGQVLGRVETPFKREEPAKVQEIAQGMTKAARQAVSVVQPGSTLWAISRETYGAGILYVNIFEANREQIRDPNLIYPGQIFELPAPPGAKKKKGSSGQ